MQQSPECIFMSRTSCSLELVNREKQRAERMNDANFDTQMRLREGEILC